MHNLSKAKMVTKYRRFNRRKVELERALRDKDKPGRSPWIYICNMEEVEQIS